MRLYVCWGTFPVPWPRRGETWRPRGHPCKRAHDALREAGHAPEVVKSYGLAPLPDAIFNRTRGRREAKRLTGASMVPVLVLDNGTAVAGSDDIVAWARANPGAAG